MIKCVKWLQLWLAHTDHLINISCYFNWWEGQKQPEIRAVPQISQIWNQFLPDPNKK